VTRSVFPATLRSTADCGARCFRGSVVGSSSQNFQRAALFLFFKRASLFQQHSNLPVEFFHGGIYFVESDFILFALALLTSLPQHSGCAGKLDRSQPPPSA